MTLLTTIADSQNQKSVIQKNQSRPFGGGFCMQQIKNMKNNHILDNY